MSLYQFLETKRCVNKMLNLEQAIEDKDWNKYNKDIKGIYSILKESFQIKEKKEKEDFTKYRTPEDINNLISEKYFERLDFLDDLNRIDFNKSITYLYMFNRPSANTFNFNLALVNCKMLMDDMLEKNKLLV